MTDNRPGCEVIVERKSQKVTAAVIVRRQVSPAAKTSTVDLLFYQVKNVSDFSDAFLLCGVSLIIVSWTKRECIEQLIS